MGLRIIKRNFLNSHRSAVPDKDAYSEVKSFDSSVPLTYLELKKEDSRGGDFVENMVAAKTRHPSRE
jgi:hypothetical protein